MLTRIRFLRRIRHIMPGRQRLSRRGIAVMLPQSALQRAGKRRAVQDPHRQRSSQGSSSSPSVLAIAIPDRGQFSANGASVFYHRELNALV